MYESAHGWANRIAFSVYFQPGLVESGIKGRNAPTRIVNGKVQFVTQADTQRQLGCGSPLIMDEKVVIRGSEVAIRDSISECRNQRGSGQEVVEVLEVDLATDRVGTLKFIWLYRISEPIRTKCRPRTIDRVSAKVATVGAARPSMVAAVPMITPPAAGAMRMRDNPGYCPAVDRAMPMSESLEVVRRSVIANEGIARTGFVQQTWTKGMNLLESQHPVIVGLIITEPRNIGPVPRKLGRVRVCGAFAKKNFTASISFCVTRQSRLLLN